MKYRNLLLVVDESRAARRALEYVSQMVAGRRNFRIYLAHSLPSPPRELAELRGDEQARIRDYKRRWISAVEMTERQELARANAIIQGRSHKGAPTYVRHCYLLDPSRVTQEVLALARNSKCDTVVIGRGSLSWLQALIQGDPAEELVKKGKGLTIWVVE